MKTLEEVLKKYVEVNGSAKVRMGGEHLNLSVPGVTKLDASAADQADVYIVNKVGVEVDKARNAVTFIFNSENGEGLDSGSEAGSVMSHSRHRIVFTSDTVVVYSTNKEVLGGEDEQVEPEETLVDHDFYANSTTIPPDEGIPFTITGAEAEKDEDEDDEQRGGQEDFKTMVW